MCARIGFHWSRVWQISFWSSAIVCQAFGWWGSVSACAGVFRCVWCGCSGVGLGALEVILGVVLGGVLCCAGGSDSACWQEVMDDGTSSPYILLFMLLLISFLVIGQALKANIYLRDKPIECFTFNIVRHHPTTKNNVSDVLLLEAETIL